MDFRQGFQNSNNKTTEPTVVDPAQNDKKNKELGAKKAKPAALNVIGTIVLTGVVLLLLLAVAAMVFTKSSKIAQEGDYVDTKGYQAVFLNNGQVYFGKVGALNSRYIDLRDVFYLTQNQTTEAAQAADYTLVKLGCQQIHHPKNQMLISREQVTFWENLENEGKVVKSIEEFKKQNPNGEECKETPAPTQSPAENVPSQSGTNTTGAGANNAPAANNNR